MLHIQHQKYLCLCQYLIKTNLIFLYLNQNNNNNINPNFIHNYHHSLNHNLFLNHLKIIINNKISIKTINKNFQCRYQFHHQDHILHKLKLNNNHLLPNIPLKIHIHIQCHNHLLDQANNIYHNQYLHNI